MSTELPQRNKTYFQKSRVVIVAATYNEKFTSALLQNCLDELSRLAPYIAVDVVRVPGAFEVPIMVKRAIMLNEERPHVVIGLGVIFRGQTAHADLIGSTITQQLMQIACDTLVPVIHEVILLDSEEQAFARCIASSLNRGCEAAIAAVAMLELVLDTPLTAPKYAR